MRGWYGNRMGHSLASKGMKSKIIDNPPITFKERKQQILYYLGKWVQAYKEEYDEMFKMHGDRIEEFQIYDDYPNLIDCINTIKYSANNMEDVRKILLEYKIGYIDDNEGINIWLKQIMIGE